MSMAISPQELEDQKKGRIGSIAFFVLLLILIILPIIHFPIPPKGQSGVLVSFGEPEQGANHAPAAAALPEMEEAEEEPVEEEVVEEKVKPKPKPPKAKPKPVKNVNTDRNSKEIAIKKQKEKELREKQRELDRIAEAERQEQLAEERAAEAEAKKRREAIAAKKRAAEAAERKRKAEADALRAQLSGGLSGSGDGKGNGKTNGDRGKPDGDPDGTALEGMSTGAGEIGGGLGNRGIKYKPKITHDSQQTGDVVVKVCVNASGNVVSADFTQGGSTTANSGLIARAVSAAKKYRFDAGSVERQCGTIKIKFRVR